jgi:hypothetical protein
MANLSMTYFPNQTNSSFELLERFRPIASKYGFNFTVKTNATQTDFVKACVQQDVVVFDGSIEGSVHNYAIASAQPMAMEHVLVVSRTYLPINFDPMRSGGAPLYPEFKDNNSILDWLEEQIVELKSKGLIPRPWLYKNMLGSIVDIFQSSFQEIDDLGKSGHIFISYRTRYFDDRDFKGLVKRVESERDSTGQPRKPFFFSPKQLSMGFMTEQERWQLLVRILRWVSTSKEIWIYETEDYYRSWWTIAELMMVAYLRHRHGDSPKIRVFKKRTGQIYDAPDDYLPVMTGEQRTRMDRFMSVSDSKTMAPETNARMRQLSESPMTEQVGYFHDYAFSDTFSRYPILDCLKCNKNLTTYRGLNIDDFLYLNEEYFIRFSPEDVAKLIKNRAGTARCPCGIQQRFIIGAPQYVWWATRVGRATGPNGNAIEARTSYEFVE